MTSDEVRRITERRNEAAAAMDACELEEAHRDDESSARSSDYGEPSNMMEHMFQQMNRMGWCGGY